MHGETLGRDALSPVLTALAIFAWFACGAPCHAAELAAGDSSHVGVGGFNLSDYDSIRAAQAEANEPDIVYRPDLDDEKKSPISGGMRFFFNIYTAEHAYIAEQLGRFDLKEPDVQIGLNISAYLTGWDYYLELEFGFDFGHPQYKLFEGETHNVTVQSANVALWFRRGFNDVFDRLWSGNPNIDFLPGVSVAYLMDANVLIQEDGRDDNDQILTGDGWGYAVGAALRWSWVFVEYRYRWHRIDAQADGGGDFYFPGDPEMDFSGHFLAVGLGYDGNMAGD